MTRKVLHEFTFGGTKRYVNLPDVYANIETATGITKVADSDDAGRPESLTDLVSSASLIRINIGVETAANQPLKNRVIYADVDKAESALGAVRGKTVPTFGTAQGGTIRTSIVRRRRSRR